MMMTSSDKPLLEHYETLQKTSLSSLMEQESHYESLQFSDESDQIVLDMSHTKMNNETIDLWTELINEKGIHDKIEGMFNGEVMNVTEKRQVMHVELRSQKNHEVQDVLDQISKFTESIRSGEQTGYDGKTLQNVLVIGIGGSYLSIEFIYEALRLHHDYQQSNMKCIRFLSNVDPIDFKRCSQGLDPSQTLVVINSKTFTTAETMMNARTVHKWILDHYQIDDQHSEQAKQCTSRHMVACSTNIEKCNEMGIQNVFRFWDWVGGRFSVTSCIGILPLSLYFGYSVMEQFLSGCQNMDQQFRTRPIRQNLPLLLGLVGYYNTQIQKVECRSIIPYCQALSKFVAHIQQLDMESNGKQCDIHNQLITDLNRTGSIIFGEPGTNSQHSFFQLLHQGRQVAVEFIGYCKSQNHITTQGFSNHDELMSNFFSQPDALALGKSLSQLEQESVDPDIINSKIFKGERGSVSILFKNELNAYNCGQLLSMYEHRVAVEGWLLGVNSFDQMGVELGKVLAANVRNVMKSASLDNTSINKSTSQMLQLYLQNRNQ